MRDEVVHRGDVVLHRALDVAGVARPEPAERQPAEARRDAAAQLELERVVGEVRDLAGDPLRRRAGRRTRSPRRRRARGSPPRRAARRAAARARSRRRRRTARSTRRPRALQRGGADELAAHRREQLGEVAPARGGVGGRRHVDGHRDSGPLQQMAGRPDLAGAGTRSPAPCPAAAGRKTGLRSLDSGPPVGEV